MGRVLRCCVTMPPVRDVMAVLQSHVSGDPFAWLHVKSISL